MTVQIKMSISICIKILNTNLIKNITQGVFYVNVYQTTSEQIFVGGITDPEHYHSTLCLPAPGEAGRDTLLLISHHSTRRTQTQQINKADQSA